MSSASRSFCALVGLSVALSACSVFPAAPTRQSRDVASLATPHRDKAARLEREGHLRRALEEWTIALTLDPGDARTRKRKALLEERIDEAITSRIGRGRAALDRGDHAEARRHFLAALALDPANQAAFEALQFAVAPADVAIHIVREGETLRTIAARYYGDRTRSEILAEANRLSPDPRLTAGMPLRIPRSRGGPITDPRRVTPAEPTGSGSPPIEDAPAPAPPAVPPQTAGREAVPQEAARETPSPARAAPPGAPPPALTEGALTQGSTPLAVPTGGGPPDSVFERRVEEPAPAYFDAIESFERGQYAIALRDVDRVLAAEPPRPAVLDLKKAILYEMGRQQFDRGQLAESHRTLTQLAALAPDYEDVVTLLDQARSELVQRHYTEGIRLFREERLAEAIAQWRVVLEYDSQHANARRNIERAERLLEGLRERRKQ